ncbi:MAG TPA: VOC family protein [Longimicrobium sp.]|nr:VOC family protein [Longimicrobium sp.]
MSIDIQYLCPLLEVFDMPTSLRFYRDVLGFRVVETSGAGDDSGWVWLSRGEGMNLMLNTAYDAGMRPPAPDPARVRAHHDTTLYFGCPDVDDAWQHLRAQGFDVPQPKVAPYGMKQLYLLDPDGYNICFQWPAAKPAAVVTT